MTEIMLKTDATNNDSNQNSMYPYSQLNTNSDQCKLMLGKRSIESISTSIRRSANGLKRTHRNCSNFKSNLKSNKIN